MFLLRILFLALPLAAAAAPASDEAAASPADAANSWRQTRDGWQRAEDFLAPEVEYRRPALHPAVVGSLEILLTLTAMLAFSKDKAAEGEKSAGNRTAEPNRVQTAQLAADYDI